MKIGELSESKFLKKEDVGNGTLLTITGLVAEEVEKEGKQETCHVLMFEEQEKGLILKPTNAAIIAKFLGSEETDDWVGQKIVLYNDPNISFAGKITGGIRARAPRVPAKPAAKPAAPVSKAPAKPAKATPERERADVVDAQAQDEDNIPMGSSTTQTLEESDETPF